MKINQLCDRFGSNRIHAAEPGELLRGCSCVAVPFAGGLCEVPHFAANIVLVNDLDRHVMNLCEVVKVWRKDLVAELDATPFHPDALVEAQIECRRCEANRVVTPNLTWAVAYFIASWMTRGGKGGTKGEFDAGLSIRWKSGGGDSVVRFRNATAALAEWETVMRRCTFTTLDAFEFLGDCKKRDIPENGIYCDPPWVDDGDDYKCGGFNEIVNFMHDDKNKPIERITKHAAMARMLASFKNTRIVVRYGECETIRELYPETLWVWNRLEGRTQSNGSKSEALLTRNL